MDEFIENIEEESEVMAKADKKAENKKIARLFILGVAIFMFMYILTRFINIVKVSGESMWPTLEDGDLLIGQRISLDIDYNDIVVISGAPPIIKRVIGLPNDTIEFKDGNVYRNGELLKEPYVSNYKEKDADKIFELKSDEYFVMGDNRDHSGDSRTRGPFSKSRIQYKIIR